MPKGASLFRCVSVSKLSVLQCIQSIIGEESYRQDTVNQWTAKIVEQALTLLVKQTKSYKYIVSCAVMQKSGAGLHTANSCYWDTVTDGMITSTTAQFKGFPSYKFLHQIMIFNQRFLVSITGSYRLSTVW
uniref:Dynein light chain Tctex-type 3 n=1 Tax=Oncorhynchus tshawytscha TaxID=74940 RepID=A0AAZ3QZX9_ONCTS